MTKCSNKQGTLLGQPILCNIQIGIKYHCPNMHTSTDLLDPSLQSNYEVHWTFDTIYKNWMLWNNLFITIGNKPAHCCYNNWREHGIKFTADLYDNGTLLSSNQLSKIYWFCRILTMPGNCNNWWREHGIKFIADLYDKGTLLSSNQLSKKNIDSIGYLQY